jgi:hypothetical protein
LFSSMLLKFIMVDIKKQQQQNANQDKTDNKKGDKRKQRRGLRPEEKKKDPDAIPILKYGPANNFMRFKDALSKKALLEFSNLGKLINQGFIIMPDLPDRDTYGLDEHDKLKLYALILKYLSNKSLEAVQKEAGWTAVEVDADPEALWQMVKMKHKVHSSSKVEAVMKLAARTQLAATSQGAFESIISFKKRYNNSLKAYNDQKNPVMKPEDIAIDFFSKLDNGRHAEFKTTFINGLQIKSV